MEMYKRIKSMADDGYSIVELVAAVGILMMLTSVVGVASYNTIQNRQTGSAVKLATQTAYNDALSAITDFDPNTLPIDSLAKSNKESKDQGISFTYAPSYPTKDSLCVIGKIKGDTKGEYTHKIGPEKCVNGAVQGLPVPDLMTLPDYLVADDITRIYYTCDGSGTRNARLNIANLAEGTRATMFGDDQSIVPVEFTTSGASAYDIKYRDNKNGADVKNYSESFQIKNGVTYELVVEGKFTNIGTIAHSSQGTTADLTDCMTEIAELGEDNGVKEISSYGAVKFVKMSEPNLPSTVTSLRYMLDSASKFNDSTISSLNTDNVTDMKALFFGASSFNRSLSNWNTAKVTDMSHMFQGASKYNQNMNRSGNKWNTNNVTTMYSMFKNATDFNGSFGSWNVTNLTNMRSMFEEADSFNQGIFSWNTNNVEDMARMFYGADSYNQALVNSDGRYRWDTSSVKNMESMFEGAKVYSNRGFAMDWDTSNVTNMKAMFKDAPAYNEPIGHWNVGKVKDMSFMFNNATSYNQNMDGWNAAQVTTFESMFHNAAKFNGSIERWQVDEMTSARNMFNNARSFNQHLNRTMVDGVQMWNAYKLDDAHGMFRDAISYNNGRPTGERGLGHTFEINHQNVRDASYMFEGATGFNTYFPTNSVWRELRNAESMFEGATAFNNGSAPGDGNGVGMTFWWGSDPWYYEDEGKEVSTSKMFKNATSFNTRIGWTHESTLRWNYVVDTSFMFEGATSFNSTLGYINTMGKVETMEGMFKNATSFNQDLTTMNTSSVTNMKEMFYNTKFNNGVKTNVAGKPISWNTGKVTDMSYMFYNTNFNQHMYGSMANVTTTKAMFYGDPWIYATISGLENTNKITDMSEMFYGATNFNSGSASNYYTNNVTNMARMFRGAASFDKNVNTWNVSKVTNMSGMFHLASSFNYGVYYWDTSKVTDMSLMFAYASSYNQAMVNNESTGGNYKWDTSNVTNMKSMFEGAYAFNNRDGSGWDLSFNTAKVTDMNNMFRNARAFNFYVGDWNTSRVTDMGSMFYGATNFNNSVIGNRGGKPIDWDTSKVTDMSYMFYNVNFNQHMTGYMTNVTTTKGMFKDNTWIHADLFGMRRTNSITDMAEMFYGATNFNHSNVTNWYTGKATRMESMFSGASSLRGHNLHLWITTNVTHYYAFGKGSGLVASNLPKSFVASSAL